MRTTYANICCDSRTPSPAHGSGLHALARQGKVTAPAAVTPCNGKQCPAPFIKLRCACSAFSFPTPTTRDTVFPSVRPAPSPRPAPWHSATLAVRFSLQAFCSSGRPALRRAKSRHTEKPAPLFSMRCALLCEPHLIFRPLFSYSCALLRPQLPCFDSHATCPRGFFPTQPKSTPGGARQYEASSSCEELVGNRAAISAPAYPQESISSYATITRLVFLTLPTMASQS